MTDSTGHLDRPNAGPINSGQIVLDGELTNYFWFQNLETSKFELIRPMPSGIPDEVVKEFPSLTALQIWIHAERKANRLG